MRLYTVNLKSPAGDSKAGESETRITSHPPRRIKYYDRENDQLDLMGFNRKLKLDEKTAISITRKLSRHFKFTEPEIYFYGSKDSGYASQHENRIKVAHEPTLGTLIHELAHRYTIEKHLVSEKFHTKKLMQTTKRFAKYIMKKNYWIKP